MNRKLRIGISACINHADSERALFKGKNLLYIEESLAHYAMQLGAIAFLLPTIKPQQSGLTVADKVHLIDGLILHGGADVAPMTYGETPLDDAWHGDRIRDLYELALVEECLKQNKPIFGVCRGLQLLNVAFGGSLYQDINTQIPDSTLHRNWDIYDRNFHQMEIVSGSKFAQLYPHVKQARINSVHHQGIKALGKGLEAQAISCDDQIIEAISLRQNTPTDPYCIGVQWHPEFQKCDDHDLLPALPILEDFYSAMRLRM